MATVFIQDSFTAGSDTELSLHAPDIGGAWSRHPSYANTGTVVASEGRFRGDSVNRAVYINATTPPSADYEVAWTARIVSALYSESGAVIRMDPAANTGYLVYYDGAQWTLRRIIAGAAAVLATYNGSEALNTDYAIQVFCIANTIDVFIDGVLRMSHTDVDPKRILTAGRCGPRCGVNGRVDNFVARTIDPSLSAYRVTQTPVLVLQESSQPETRVTQTFALVMAGTGIPARITQAAVLVLSTARPCARRECQCWKITRTDGVVLAFTTHDMPVTFMGVTYAPCGSLRASATTHTSASGLDTGDVQAEGVIEDNAITARDLATGAYDGARVEVWEVDWLHELPPRRITQGLVDVVEHDDTTYKLTVLTPGARLSQQPLLPTITPACRWELGDSRCTVDIDALKETGDVESVEARNVVTQTTRRRWLDSSLTAADGYYDQGTVVWLTGSNAPRVARVKTFAAGVVTLWEVLPNEIEPGDTYDIYPGCDKLKATCISKFSNIVNFGGFPDLPGIDAISETPNAKA